MGQGRSRMLDLLDLVTAATPAEPQLGRDAHPEVHLRCTPAALQGERCAGTQGLHCMAVCWLGALHSLQA